jgi:choline-sulfatase
MHPPPNIVLIVTDQQRFDALGCSGHSVLRTPHLDRLAARGVRFERAYTTSPLCMPMRASLVSGGSPHNHGVWGNGSGLPTDDPTFMHHLQQAGYFTAHVGNGHYFGREGLRHLREREADVRARGFDYVLETTGPNFARTVDSAATDELERRGLLADYRALYGVEGRAGGGARERHGSADAGQETQARRGPWSVTPFPLAAEHHLDAFIGRSGAAFIQQYDQDRPFYLFLGFGGPHNPWDAPDEYAAMYDPAQVPARIPAAAPGPWVPAHAAQRMLDGRAPDIDEAGTRRMRANYYGKISLIDRHVGQLLDVLDRRGLTENTLILFTSDHGEMAGDHDRFHKTVFYDASVRVPLIAAWPGHVASGAVAPTLAETNDLPPTILEAAGVEVGTTRVLGRSLWPALRQPSATVRDDVLSEVSPRPGRRERTTMLCTATHKYAVDESSRGYLLHDLTADPDEQVNLIGRADQAAVEAALRDRLLDRLLRDQWQR